jgi:two-component system, cell cycle response regulator
MSGGLYLTCSIGIASYPAHATELNVLINAADQAMYAAKRLGRNQQRLIDDPMVQSILANSNSEGGREEVALNGFVAALIALMEQRDTALGEHAIATADLAEQLAIQLGVSANEVRIIRLAAQLHNIGKIGIPDAILRKSAHLTPDENLLMERHPALGAEIVTYIPPLRPLAPVIRAHHERWDGTGYPDQLRGEDIPFAARVIAVASAYAIMSTNHLHQKIHSSNEMVQELQCGVGTQFDPAIIQALSTILVDQRKQPLRQAV